MNKNEYQTISDFVVLLNPVKATVEALCRQDATLVTADIALEFMLTEIKQQQSKIGKQLFSALTHHFSHH